MVSCTIKSAKSSREFEARRSRAQGHNFGLKLRNFSAKCKPQYHHISMADSSKEPPAASAAVPGKKIGLAELRALLLRLEETIIFALIERACFKVNARLEHAQLLSMKMRAVRRMLVRRPRWLALPEPHARGTAAVPRRCRRCTLCVLLLSFLAKQPAQAS